MENNIRLKLNLRDLRIIESVWLGTFKHSDDLQCEQAEETFDKLMNMMVELREERRK